MIGECVYNDCANGATDPENNCVTCPPGKVMGTDEDGMESIVYATSKIPTASKSLYSGQVEGAVLCTISTIGAGDAKIESIQTATEVTKGKIEISAFDILDESK